MLPQWFGGSVAQRRFSPIVVVSTMLAISLLAPPRLPADSVNNSQRTVTKLAEGVYEIRHPDAPDGFPQGNTTVIVGERGVLVVDSCFLPSSARLDVEQIRKWTDKPVTYLGQHSLALRPYPGKRRICGCVSVGTNHRPEGNAKTDRRCQSRCARTISAAQRKN